MKEAIIPFISYCILQLPVGLVGLNVVREKQIDICGILKSWIFGQMLLYAILQIIAVPMILLRWKFNALFWSYVGVAIVLLCFGCQRLARSRIKIRLGTNKNDWNWLTIAFLVVALVLILYQSGQYFFKMHLDEDDARWLAEANDALEYGDLITRNAMTGEYIGSFDRLKSVSSPMFALYAILSKLLFSTRVSITAHTLFAPVMLLTMYAINYLIASELFKDNEARLCFLLFTAVGNMFYGGTSYTQSAFSLVRIWQGKGMVAGVVVPALIYLSVAINKKNKTSDWLILLITDCAACLMSGMGISLALIVILILGLSNIISYRNWKRIPALLLAISPSVVCASVYFFYGG